MTVTAPSHGRRGAALAAQRAAILAACLLAIATIAASPALAGDKDPQPAGPALTRPVPAADGRDLYVAAQAAAGGDGSATRPFATLAAALPHARGGDRIRLAPGHYPPFRLRNRRFDPPLEIAGPSGSGKAHIGPIALNGVSGLTLRHLHVAPGSADPSRRAQGLLAIRDGARIVVAASTFRSTPQDPKRWRAADWLHLAWSGIRAEGREIAITGNRVETVRHGIGVTGPDNRVEGNHVDGFSGDGLRGNGDRVLVRGNRVANCYKVDDNHDDGFQAWTRGPKGPGDGRLTGGRVEGNEILEWTGPPHPLRCRLQGIGLFDGIYDGWTIANNFVAVSSWHGISLRGARDTRILHNTVVSADLGNRPRPWISIGPHKRTEDWFSGNIVANNIAPNFRPRALGARRQGLATGLGITGHVNLVLPDDASTVFAGPTPAPNTDPGDYRPRPGGPAAGGAWPGGGPSKDASGRNRPATGASLGAWEP